MIAQNGKMAVMEAGPGLRAPACDGFPTAPAFSGERRRSHQSDRDPSASAAPGVAIAMSSIEPVAKTPRTGESNIANLAHATVVCSTIASGRMVDIDLAAAWRVKGVLSIFTHQNFPDIVDDQACADATIPPGSHFRLLHDKEIMFKGQPIALVVARTAEIARFAASLVRVEYESHAHVADAHLLRDVASDDDDPMELGESTAIFESPSRISIVDTTRGAQGLRQYFLDRLGSGLRPQFQATLAARAALALQCSVRVVLTLQQMRDLACAPRQPLRSR